MTVKVGLLLDAYKPVINGITNFVSLHRRALEAAGHETTVFTWAARGYVDDEPRVVRSPILLPLGGTGYALALSFGREAQARLATMDVLHVQHPFISGPLALRYARPRALPVVYTNHTRYDLYAGYYARFARAAGEGFVRAMLPRFCARCDLVVAPAPGVAAALRALGVRTPITIIGNGIDVGRFEPRRAARERSPLGLTTTDRVILYTGRLGPEKDLPVLLRAFAAAARAEPRLRLVLIGRGPEEGALRALAAALAVDDRVRFEGAVPYEQIPAYLMLADVWASASRTEVHPLSVLEALASGLPVVALDVAGMCDVVAHGENGLLAAGASELANHFVRLAVDDELRAGLADGARRSRAQFDITATTARYVAEYERVLAKRRRR